MRDNFLGDRGGMKKGKFVHVSPCILSKTLFRADNYLNLFHDTPKSVCRTLKINYICNANGLVPLANILIKKAFSFIL